MATGARNLSTPNMIVKIPVTRAGITAIEEATYRGISINATVCFSLPQCIAVAEALNVDSGGGKRRISPFPRWGQFAPLWLDALTIG